MSADKKIQIRRRNVIILIQSYLISFGYVNSASQLSKESTITLDQCVNRTTADNIDLYQILTEFEEFYELKFNKPPVLVKKVEDQQTKQIKQQVKNQITSMILDKATKKSNQPKKVTEQENSPSNEEQLNFQVEGQKIESQQKKKSIEEEANDFYENRVLKALPSDLLNIPDLKNLALYLQRDICISSPGVKFSDVTGLIEAKNLLKESVMIPLKYPYLFTGLLEPWKGILLFGPPGTGKTMLAKAVATECHTTFFNISASSIVSKWRGDSEKLIRVLFELARHYQPSTVFLDEIDSIMGQRTGGDNEHEGSRRMKTELLLQLDGLVKNKEQVFLLAASNLPWDLDQAMLRRFEKRIYIPLPNEKARAHMLKKFLAPPYAEQLDYDSLSKQMVNYSGSDIKQVCKECAMKSLRKLIAKIDDFKIEECDEDNLINENDNIQNQKKKMINQKQQLKNNQNQQQIKPEPATLQDFLEALNQVKPSPAIKQEQYLKWEKEFGAK